MNQYSPISGLSEKLPPDMNVVPNHVRNRAFEASNFFAGLVVAISLSFSFVAPAANLTALDRYVAKPDTNYSYKLVNTLPGTGQTTFVVEMTSQAWLTTNEVNRTLWKHWL